MMKRTIRTGGKERELTELEDVVAYSFRGATRANLGPSFSLIETEVAATRRVDDPSIYEMASDEDAAFSAAGWNLGIPTDTTRAAMRESAQPFDKTFVRRVFRNVEGHTLIESDRLVIKFAAGLGDGEMEGLLKAQNLDLGRADWLRFGAGLVSVAVAEGTDVFAMAEQLSEDQRITYAEPELIQKIGGRLSPTDARYPEQWHLNNDGFNGSTPGADISAEEAWDLATGRGVRLAVVDNGFDVLHPDLAPVQDASGFFRRSSLTSFQLGLVGFPVGTSDHGTFCAGIACARGNLGAGSPGICGVAFESDLIAIAAFPDQVGTQKTLAKAIAYAADPSVLIGATPPQGADVISCSLGPNGSLFAMESVLQDAIDSAVTNGRGGLGTPVFWAVTNGNHPIASDEVCSHPNTIAVGRSDSDDFDNGSGFGAELDFLATGVDVLSTTNGTGYRTDTGTSYAAPCAAGVAALLLELDPTLRWEEVRDRLRATCVQAGTIPYVAGRNDIYGFGRVDAAAALA